MAYRYEVTVWNTIEGDIVKKLWEATEDELGEIEDWYADEPFHEVVIDREWGVDDDED